MAADWLINGGPAGAWNSDGRNAVADPIPDTISRPPVFSAANRPNLDAGGMLFGLETTGDGEVRW